MDNPSHSVARLKAAPVKRIFSTIVLIGTVLTSNHVLAQSDTYESWGNGEVHHFIDHLYTKVVLDGQQYSKNANRLSIAQLYGQRNIMLHPFRQLEWDKQYSKGTQRIFTNEYLRLVKISAHLNGLKLEQQWVQDSRYQFVFSIPEAQVVQMQKITSADVISTLQQAVLDNNKKLNSIAMLEVALRYPTLFNMNSIVSQINEQYGNNLLKFMSGVELNNTSEWPGDENTLSKLKLDELLQLQSQYPYDRNISYHLALVLKAHQYEKLLHRVVENSLNISSVGDSAQPLVHLADTLGISHAPYTETFEE
jgi:hypothetical protein